VPLLPARRSVIALVAAGALATGVFVGTPANSAAITWAPAATAPIHPGVQTDTQGGLCTSNFIFSNGTDVYIGQAAHCSSFDGPTATDGCEARSRPVGTRVTITGASRPGTMVYNSWVTMRAVGETDPNVCQYNDLALVRIHPADVAKVNPSVPKFGGPTGLAQPPAAGQRVYSYGNSALRAGLLSRKEGVSLGQQGNGWSSLVYTATQGIPGDSGSGFLNASGKAFGVLSTVYATPVPLSNGVGSLAKELAYMKAKTSLDGVNLVKGTVPFSQGIR
jgi:hypothetical protein